MSLILLSCKRQGADDSINVSITSAHDTAADTCVSNSAGRIDAMPAKQPAGTAASYPINLTGPVSIFEPGSKWVVRQVTLKDIHVHRPELEYYLQRLQSDAQASLRMAECLGRGLLELAGDGDLEARRKQWLLTGWLGVVRKPDCGSRERGMYIAFIDALARVADANPSSGAALGALLIYTREEFWVGYAPGKSRYESWLSNPLRRKLIEMQKRAPLTNKASDSNDSSPD